MANLNKVVELNTRADDCRVGLSAVNASVCTELDIILYYDITQLRNLSECAICLGCEAEAVSTNNDTCVDDTVLTHYATIVNLYTRIELCALADGYIVTNVALGIDLHIRTNLRCALNNCEVANEATLAKLCTLVN